jgi:hypothetical protein
MLSPSVGGIENADMKMVAASAAIADDQRRRRGSQVTAGGNHRNENDNRDAQTVWHQTTMKSMCAK